MIRFLLKGVWRDASRSRLPILIVAAGVFLTIIMSSFVAGVIGDVLDLNARFTTGHLKVMTGAYAQNQEQLPNDLALLQSDTLETYLHHKYPKLQWVHRIRFGGLLDVPDSVGESRAQGPVQGLAIDLLNRNHGELERWQIETSLTKGSIPNRLGEILISDLLAAKLGIKVQDEVTLLGTTMNGGMAFQNFVVAGMISFGNAAMDRGGIIVDLEDAREMLDMQNGTGELLGYFTDGEYHDGEAAQIERGFNRIMQNSDDEFAPVMYRLKAQNQLAELIDYTDQVTSVLIFVFVLAMSIVLWNTGLLGGLRRFTEFGLRLALGETKGHIYRTLIYESFLIGCMGTLLGTSLGIVVAFWLAEKGLDIGAITQSSSMMMPSVMKGKISPSTFYIGLIPGLFSMVLGQALSGLGIFKRQTAQLFKELEV